MRRIWFKPLMVERLKQGKKWTTFRRRKHRRGLYECVHGRYTKPTSYNLVVFIEPLKEVSREELIKIHYLSEGFEDPASFEAWLKAERLRLPDRGWLHRVKVIYPSEHSSSGIK